MGGVGSGNRRPRWGAKPLAEDCEALDVNWLNRQGWLKGEHTVQLTWTRGSHTVGKIKATTSSSEVVLFYYYRDGISAKWEPVLYSVRLDWTPCHFGGKRPWFVCPGCHRRAAKLYRLGRYFLCRRCQNLAYKSQREDRAGRLVRKADKIRTRLGGKPGMLNPFPPKPKGMHWRTYLQLRDEAAQLEMEAVAELRKKIARLERWTLKRLPELAFYE